MTKYLVLKILDNQGVYLPYTLIYGSVEIRSCNADSEYEVDILKESALRNGIDFNMYLYCARIISIVESEDVNEAIDIADDLFSEILDLKSRDFFSSILETSNIGYVKKLESGGIQPIIRNEFKMPLSFVVNKDSIQRIDISQYIYSLNSELSRRYLRSLHWSRNSQNESNSQIKILFCWFAIEALFKETEHDHIGGMVRWFLGFPNGSQRNDVLCSIIKELRKHPKYDYWNKELITIVDDIRIFRNNSVHSGFRSFDFTKKKLKYYKEIMAYSAPRCQNAVRYALINGISTVSEFKEYVAIIFEENIRINDVHYNILFSFEQARCI